MNSLYNVQELINIAGGVADCKDVPKPTEIIERYRETFKILDTIPSTIYFIHDFINYKFILISKSVKNIVGIEGETYFGENCNEAFKNLHPEDTAGMKSIHEEIFKFLFKVPEADRRKLRFDFNYRMRTASGDYKCILQQSMFIVFSGGRPVYDFSTCTDITLQKRRHKMELLIHKLNEENIFEVVHFYEVRNVMQYSLSKAELKIMEKAATGLSMKEIALQLARSLNTVHNHRKNILSKTNSKTFQEALLKVDFLQNSL